MIPPYTIGAQNRVKLYTLAEAQNWRCCYCGIRCHGEPNSRNAPTREHVIPVVAFGLHEWENEVMACGLCNNGRGAMYARSYVAAVLRMGRWKAYRWAAKKRKKRALARPWGAKSSALSLDSPRAGTLDRK